jgi:aminoglycoside N3'-acetyltransferase
MKQNTMSDYIEITFKYLQTKQQDVLIAHSSEAGFDGFEENNNRFRTFVQTLRCFVAQNLNVNLR